MNMAGTRGTDWHLLTAGAFVSMILPLYSLREGRDIFGEDLRRVLKEIHVDTSGMLYRLTRRENPIGFTKGELEEDLNFANIVASICVTRRGAIPALPTLSEVEKF